jgi:hypothetical protein
MKIYIFYLILALFLFIQLSYSEVMGGGEIIGSSHSFPEIFSKERESQVPLPGEGGRSPVSPPSSTQPLPSTHNLEKGAYNPRTGEVYPGTFEGVINPRTGEILPKVGSGYMNPKTGVVLPAK